MFCLALYNFLSDLYHLLIDILNHQGNPTLVNCKSPTELTRIKTFSQYRHFLSPDEYDRKGRLHHLKFSLCSVLASLYKKDIELLKGIREGQQSW